MYEEVNDLAGMLTLVQQRTAAAPWWAGATVSQSGQPRSRVLHPVWEGETGWVTTRLASPKISHLRHSPHMTLTWVDPGQPITIQADVTIASDLPTVTRIWELCRALGAEEGGFDPAEAWGPLEAPGHAVLRLDPTRIDVADFGPSPRVRRWRRPS